MYNDNNENDSQYRYSGSHITILIIAVQPIITQHFQVHLMKLRSTRNTKADLQRKQHALFFQQYFLAQ